MILQENRAVNVVVRGPIFKDTHFCWVGVSELDILKENRAPDDTLIFNLVRKALAL